MRLMLVSIYLIENGFHHYILLFTNYFIEQLLTNEIESKKTEETATTKKDIERLQARQKLELR